MDGKDAHQPVISLARIELVISLALGGIFGGAVAALVTLLLTRDGVAAGVSGLVVGGATFATLWPMAFLRGQRSSVVAAGVLGMSAGRVLAVLGLGLGVDLAMELPRQGYWLGVLGGAIVVLTIETAALLIVIRLQRSSLHA